MADATTPQGTTSSVSQMVATKGLTLLAGYLAAHGWIGGDSTTLFIAAGLLIVSFGASFWKEYGRAIFVSQLEIIKAKSLAQAAALSKNGIAPVTVLDIAAHSPTLDVADVQKGAKNLPPEIKANVPGIEPPAAPRAF